MEYKININPQEKIKFNKLKNQVNGLSKLAGDNSYGAECLLLRFSKSCKWLYILYFDSATGKSLYEGNVAVSPEGNLIWLYCLLKDDVNYKYIETIFPESVFTPCAA